MPRKVLFARISPQAHAWAMEKVRTSAESDMSVSVVVERLLMNDKRKVEANRQLRASKRGTTAEARV